MKPNERGLPGLRLVRTSLGLSQADLAKLAGVSAVAVRHVETGVRDCSLAFARQLADSIGCKVADLLEDPDGARLSVLEVLYFQRRAKQARERVGA